MTPEPATQEQPADRPASETPQPAAAPAEAGGATAAQLAEIQAGWQTRVAELEKKLSEMRDQALRAMAETENTRKRYERERQDTAKFAVSSFARDLLAVADNLRRALAAIPPETLEKSPEFKNIYTGVEATERELLRIFENNGIRRIDPLNQKFDANQHEVMFEMEAPGRAPGTVVQVIDAGYTIHERLLRPARVGVAKGEAPAAGVGANVDKEV